MHPFQGFATVLIGCAALLFPFAPTYGAGTTAHVSVNSGGVPGNASSFSPALSSDGRYVAFSSRASNFVAGDTYWSSDIFVHDSQAGTTTLVSIDSDGNRGDNWSYNPDMSDDGRYIAFDSDAANLVAGDTNQVRDIFVHDRQTGETTRVSVDSIGTQSDAWSFRPALSADGRYVAFSSYASNLVPNDTNGNIDVFVHDRQTGETTRVSVDSTGAEVHAPYRDVEDRCALSGDGRYVAFSSYSSELVADDTNGQHDVFVHDRETGETTRASVSSTGTEGDGYSSGPTLSDDGHIVAFTSSATNLVDGDTNAIDDVFMHGLWTGETTRMNLKVAGSRINGGSNGPAVSADGRYVAFVSGNNGLVANDTNQVDDVFIHDRQTSETLRISINSNGIQSDENSFSPAISADGRHVAFVSDASNLAASSTNAIYNIFAHTWSPTLSIHKAGNGVGQVTSLPAGISCGSLCSAAFESTTPVALTALALDGSTFTGWSGPADCADGIVTLADNFVTCTATFVSTISVSATDNTADELGYNYGEVIFTRTGDTDTELTVTYSLSGTATQDSDYAWNTTVTFRHGAKSVTKIITPIADMIPEPDETIIIQIEPSSQYAIGDAGATTIYISDEPPVVTVKASDPVATEAGHTSGQFTFTRTSNAVDALEVFYTIGGDATANLDYRALRTHITFPVGVTTVTTTVNPIDDTTIEPKERVTIELTIGPNYEYTIGGSGTASVAILSDDIPSVTVSAIDATATEAGRSTGKFKITRSGNPYIALKVYFKIGGTATAGRDYNSLGSSAVFPAGVSTLIGTVVPIDDKLREPRERIVLQLLPNDAYTMAAPRAATVTIISNE